jgi:hypothetical protein
VSEHSHSGAIPGGRGSRREKMRRARRSVESDRHRPGCRAGGLLLVQMVVVASSRARLRMTRAPRALLRVCVGLLVVVAVVFGPVQSGARYFYCDAVGLMAFDPCAQASEQAHMCPLEALQSQSADCCQRITMPTMPDGARASERTVAPAALVSLLPAADYVTSHLPVLARSRVHWARRWRRPPPATGDLHTQLMVFLT